MMTYAEALQKDPNLITIQIDQPTKDLLFDWFQFREVCDNNKFKVFFNRYLNKDYKTYTELLRIQPGYAAYDWLVSEYLEEEAKSEKSINNINNKNIRNTATGSNTQNIEGTSNTEETGEDRKRGNEITTNRANETNNVNSSKTGGDTHEKTGTNTATKTGKDGRVIDLNESSNGTNNQESQRGQNINETTTSNNTSNSSSEDSGASDNVSYAKALPQQSGNSTGRETANGINILGAPNWDYATSAAESSNQSANSSSSNTTDSGTVEKLTNFLDGKDTQKITTDNTHLSTTQDDITYNNTLRTDIQETSEATYNISDKVDSTAEATGESSTTYNIKNNNNKNINETNQQKITNNKNDAMISEEQATAEGAENSKNNLIKTGRNQAPAELLAQAKNFIMASSAWEFLAKQLEPCFLAIYD